MINILFPQTGLKEIFHYFRVEKHIIQVIFNSKIWQGKSREKNTIYKYIKYFSAFKKLQ